LGRPNSRIRQLPIGHTIFTKANFREAFFDCGKGGGVIGDGGNSPQDPEVWILDMEGIHDTYELLESVFRINRKVAPMDMDELASRTCPPCLTARLSYSNLSLHLVDALLSRFVA